MKMYKIKHIPTGLYLGPISGSTNLLKNGKVYQTKNNLISHDLNHGYNRIKLQISKKQYDKFKDTNNCEFKYGGYFLIAKPEDFAFEEIINNVKNIKEEKSDKVSPGMIVKKLDFILDEINLKFGQNNMPEYYKPYDYGECKVFFWPCGGILLWKRWCAEFSEDDGHWFISKQNPEYISHSWLIDKEKCYKATNKWLKQNGKPYYYSGTDIICGYEI